MLTQHMSPVEVEEAARYAMSGGRGYGGDCYAGRVIPDQRADDARGLLMESARSLGILGEQIERLSLFRCRNLECSCIQRYLGRLFFRVP